MSRANALLRGHSLLSAIRPLPMSVTDELRHRYEVQLTYHSTAIEGNTLTQSETQIVIEKGITIAGKSLTEHLEVVGHKEALDFVRSLAEEGAEIGEREIREIHSLVMKGQGNGDVGAFRTLDVRAAGTDFVYPSHLKVPNLMSEFVSWMRGQSGTVEFAAEAHARFVTIHPFRDGNGRVGRLLMNVLLLRAGYPIAILLVEKRAEYIDALVEAQCDDNLRPLVALVEESVLRSMRDTLAVCASSEEVRHQHPQVFDQIKSWLDETGY